MHEMHLVRDMFDDLLSIAKKNKAGKITKIYIEMGKYSEISPKVLEFYFKEQGKGTIVEDAQIVIKPCNKRQMKLLSFDCD